MKHIIPIVVCGFGLLHGSVANGQISRATVQELLHIAKERELTTDDLYAAAATYTPPPVKDEFMCLNSGGQAGSMIAYGVPSMRMLKYVPTAAPDSSQGYNYDLETQALIASGAVEGKVVTWGDTHHPSFSETDGKYDGKWAFINDKANPRIFVVDLRDFETKQIIANPIYRSNHGGAFVTPNSEYIIEGSQYAAPPDRQYYPLDQENFNEHYRGGLTFWKFDNENGRILEGESFTVLAPPYTQDLSDAGKGESYGWAFTNSFCSERYVGGIERGRPPYEAGCSTKDTDYLHVVNWQRAEEVFKEGKKTVQINNHTVIPLEVAAEEGIMFLVPEPKSPHGADVSPDGRYIIVAGKLDTHATIFDFRKIKALIEAKDFADYDPYGLPILDLQKSIHGQLQLGLGPLHTQFDKETGVAYTSIFIDSVIVKWNYLTLEVLDKISVHYNVGHLVAMAGDTVEPRGKYVIGLNKLALDRFNQVGPLLPQNHQLIDTQGDTMRLIYDLPIPMGEPHYTVCIDPESLQPLEAYDVGLDPVTMRRSPHATLRGEEKVVEKDGKLLVFATVSQEGGIQPRRVEVEQGKDVIFHITNVETEPGRTFKFTVSGYNALGIFAPGKTASIAFNASQAGSFNFRTQQFDAPFPDRRFGQLTVRHKAAVEQARIQRAREMRIQRANLAKGPDMPMEERELLAGEAEFQNYGCGGCHIVGLDAGGPDLTDVTVRRDDEWLVNWIVNPEQYYDDPSIVAMALRFAAFMPNQGVTEEDARKIVQYLKTLESERPAVSETTESDHPGAVIYANSCFACHDAGVAGAPRAGVEDDWEKRLQQPMETIYQHAIDGFMGETGYMPPKGACADCSDDDIKAAVDFMLQQIE